VSTTADNLCLGCEVVQLYHLTLISGRGSQVKRLYRFPFKFGYKLVFSFYTLDWVNGNSNRSSMHAEFLNIWHTAPSKMPCMPSPNIDDKHRCTNTPPVCPAYHVAGGDTSYHMRSGRLHRPRCYVYSGSAGKFLQDHLGSVCVCLFT
jgi:hypothetical protein